MQQSFFFFWHFILILVGKALDFILYFASKVKWRRKSVWWPRKNIYVEEFLVWYKKSKPTDLFVAGVGWLAMISTLLDILQKSDTCCHKSKVAHGFFSSCRKSILLFLFFSLLVGGRGPSGKQLSSHSYVFTLLFSNLLFFIVWFLWTHFGFKMHL